MTDAISVRCRCGGVEIEISADPIAQFFCHCDDCQAVHGAAFVPESVYPASAVNVTRGQPSSWTLKRNPRFTCPDCGTRLLIDVLSLGPARRQRLPPSRGTLSCSMSHAVPVRRSAGRR